MKKVVAPGLDHVTPLYPKKLTLTSPIGGGHSVGIVRVRTKATEFSLFIEVILKYMLQKYAPKVWIR